METLTDKLKAETEDCKEGKRKPQEHLTLAWAMVWELSGWYFTELSTTKQRKTLQPNAVSGLTSDKGNVEEEDVQETSWKMNHIYYTQ